MDDIDSSFREQQKLEDSVNLKAMLIQLCINLIFTVSVLIIFSWLRPRHAFIYAPKNKLCKSDLRRPTRLNPGWLDWIKPVFKVKDDALLQIIGFDGFVFIYFTRMLRKLIIILTVMSIFVFLPVNILATYSTGDWPPAPGLDFMSISAMNYQSGKESKKTNLLWYWSPTIATWLFSVIIILQLFRSSEAFIQFRRKYYLQQEIKLKAQLSSLSPTELLQHQKDDLVKRTLLVHFNNNNLSKKPPRRLNSNAIFRPNIEMKQTIDKMSNSSCEQVLSGKYNARIYFLVNDYNRIIKSLERVMNPYLSRIKQEQFKHNNLESGILVILMKHVDITVNPVLLDELAKAILKLKRPMIKLNWKSKQIDAINYYTERALSLDAAIKRNRSKLQDCNYGWAVFSSVSKAHNAFLSIQEEMAKRCKEQTTFDAKQCIRLRLAPQPEDIIWPNMNIERHTAELKRWFGYGLFFSIVFIWSVPIAMLAVGSNLINFIRLFKEANEIIKKNELLMGLIQSYLIPLLMVLFQVYLPKLLGLVSRQQAYKTNTIVEQKILWKLYMFFVANNLVIFTLVNIMLGIVGQITALTLVGTLKSKRLSDYVVQIAKNMSDVSSFWINYVCLRSVGVVFDLLQVAPLLFIVVLPNRFAGSYRYTPRQLDNFIGSPPPFQYAKNYGLIISFFTAALVYSVTTPIVLPFALIYFGLATTIFKYKLMYIYVTKTETHGRIWPLLYRIVMLSLIVFQAMTILILSLKAGLYQIYSLLPLPFITLVIGLLYLRRLKKNNKLKKWVDVNNNLNRPPSTRQSLQDEEIEPLDLALPNNAGATLDRITARDAHIISTLYLDPCLHEPLWKPMLYDDIKQIVPLVYKDHRKQEQIINLLYSENNDSQTTDNQPQTSEISIPVTTPLDEVVPLTGAQNEKKLQMQNQAFYSPPPPSINPHSIPYYYQESEDLGGGGGSSSRHPIYFAFSSQSSLEELNTMPTAPTLQEILRRDNADDSPIEESPASLAFIPVPPPTYADVVLPRINFIQSITRQTQQRRHST